MLTSNHCLWWGIIKLENKTQQRLQMKVWWKEGLDSGHENFLRELEISLLLD
jgi:hypothetical protein